MVHFVGAGSGAPDLITLRGARLLGEADVVIYAGSLVNPELLTLTKPGCEVHDSAKHNWPTVFYTAEELRSVPGEFTDSPFVQEMTGVGNVCERAAMRGAEKLLVKKTAVDGVTVAVAAEHWEVTFG